MNAIEKIIAQMNEQASAEQAALEQAEKKRIEEEYQQALVQLNNDFEKQRSRQVEAIDSKYRQLNNRQQVEIRQGTLNEKQQFLAILFKKATEQMEAWDVAQAQAFAENALKELPITGTVQFIPGEKSQTIYTKAWLTKVQKELSYVLDYSTETISKQAGFVVDDQGVQYNFIFENLVKDIQGQMSFEIANQLFG